MAGRSFRPGACGGRRGGRRGASALDAVDELLRLDLIRETEVPRRFRFRHPLVRRAVYEVGPCRLAPRRARAERRGARGPRRAPRRTRSPRRAAGRQGDAVAVADAARGRRGGRHRAPASAAPGSRARCGSSPMTRSGEERVELLLARAGALAACGHFAEATPRCSRASSSSRTMRSRCASGSRRRAPASSICSAATRTRTSPGKRAESLADPDSPEAAALMIELALDGVYRMEFEQIGTWAGRALEIARPLGDRPLTAGAAAILAWGAGLSGAAAEAEAYRAEAAALVDALSDHELASARRRRQPRRRRALPRPFRRGGRPRRTSGRRGASDRTTGVRPLRLHAPGLGQDAARRAGRGRRDARRRRRGGAGCSATPRAWPGSSSTAHSPRSRPATSRSRSAPPRRASSSPAGWTTASSRRRRGWRSPPRSSRPATRSLGGAVELLLERTGGAELPLMPGGSFRAKWLELLTRCWLALGPPGRRRTRRRLRRGHAPPRWEGSAWRRRWQTRRGGRRRSPPATPPRRPSGRSPPQPPRTTSACRSKPRSRARSPAAHSRRPANPSGGCRARARRRAYSTPAARAGTAMQPTTNCDGSAVTSTGARSPARPAQLGVGALTERERAGRATRSRPQDEPGDRRHPVPQPEDRRDTHAKHLPQARRRLTGRSGARRRARRPRCDGP